MVQLENEFLSVAIDETGGKLQSLRGKQEDLEYLWQKRMPNLFPFVGRLYEKTYTLNGKPYPMEMHGFLSSAEMAVEARDGQSCCLLLTDTEATRACYPFAFALRLKYSLRGHTLQIGVQVENRSRETLYCGIGGHPGFYVPMEEGLAFEDYELTFSRDCAPSLVEFSDSILCTGRRTPYPLVEQRRLPLRHELFSLDAVVLADTPRSVTLSSPKGRHGVCVDCPDMPYLGFWQPNHDDPQFLCIEPWSVLPGRQDTVEELSRMPDMAQVPAGGEYHNNWSITVF